MTIKNIKEQLTHYREEDRQGYFENPDVIEESEMNLCYWKKCTGLSCDQCIGNLNFPNGELEGATWDTIEEIITIKLLLGD